MSFRLKTVLGIALIEALLLTILVLSGLDYLRESNENQIVKRAQSSVKLVATMTGDATVALDLATLDALVEDTLRNPDLVYVRIIGSNGATLSAGGDAAALAAPFAFDTSIETARSDNRLDVTNAIIVGGEEFGRVELGMSIDSIDATLEDALIWMAGIALSEMGLVALLGWALGHYLTRQLVLLRHGAKQVAAGDFGRQLPISGRDELAETAEAFNKMSASLAEYAKVAEEARRQAEIGRAFAESTLRDALDSMSDGVLVLDADQKVILANRSYRETYDASDLNTASDAFAAEAQRHPEAGADFVDERLRQLASAPVADRREAQLDGGERLLLSQHRMSAGGAVLVQTDVTALYKALDDNRRLETELMQRQKAAALGTLAGGIAHEMNTPVQFMADNAAFVAESVERMIAVADALGQSAPDAAEPILDDADWAFLSDETPEAVNEIVEGLTRLRELIETFRQFSTGGKTAKETADLDDILAPVIDDARAAWASVAEFEVDMPTTLPSTECNINQIQRVIRALIDNAAHAIEDADRAGSGKISIRLAVGEETRDVTISVADNGCGIAPENISKIFDMLFTTKDPGRGVGHGLSVCQAIVERGHDGKLAIESDLGRGTTVSVCLPSAQPSEPQIELAEAS